MVLHVQVVPLFSYISVYVFRYLSNVYKMIKHMVTAIAYRSMFVTSKETGDR